MDSTPMAHVSGGTHVPGSACRINALPTDLLLRAISHLEARQVVQTCVLSRRWRDLWRDVPCINASCHEFELMADTDEECGVLFKKFINRFLLLRNPVPLDEFCLCYHVPDTNYPYADSEDANLWIHHALQSNARSVEVFDHDRALMLDPVVFASKCLLRSLLLSNVFLEPPFFRNLQTGCTVLEHLNINHGTILDAEISSETLKVLTIDYNSCAIDAQVTISIPSLIYLEFFPDLKRIPLLKNMDSLKAASIAVGTENDQVHDICQFLRGLSGVKNLEFYYKGPTLDIAWNLQWCPKFNNLTALKLGGWCLHGDFYPLIVFLQNSPNLKKLTLKGKWESLGLQPRIFGDPEDRSFTCEHLVMVVIDFPNSKGSEDDPVVISLVKLFCDNGITPDKIIVF